jgi:hypothetical protein
MVVVLKSEVGQGRALLLWFPVVLAFIQDTDATKGPPP